VKTALTDKLLIRHPIIQAPIGTCGGPELAGAVSNAGALGSMAIWAYAPDIAARLVGELAALTSRPFSVNIRADLNQHEHTRVALDAGARVIHLFWGDPAPYVQLVRAAGAKLLSTGERRRGQESARCGSRRLDRTRLGSRRARARYNVNPCPRARHRRPGGCRTGRCCRRHC